MTLVDTNVLLDVATKDPSWSLWSLRALQKASLRGSLLINGVIYAELSVRYEQMEDLDEFLAQAETDFVEIPKAAFFLAAKALRQYKASGGPRDTILPDFFIGAHAATLGVPLITRDVRRYRTYFPDLMLITPTLS